MKINYENKIKVIYDISVITNALHNNSGRSGIFFVAYNILLELSKRKDISLYLYTNKDFCYETYEFIKQNPNRKNLNFYYQNNIVQNYLLKLRTCLKLNKRKNKNNLILKLLNQWSRFFVSIPYKAIKILKKNKFNTKDCIFLSPIFKIPNKFRNDKNIKKFTISHDMIPLILGGYKYKKNKGGWFEQMMNSLDKSDYIFTVSNHSKKDLLKFNKRVDKNKITTTYLATSDNFYQCKDKDKINQVLNKYKIPKNTKYIFSLCTLEPRKNLIHAVKCFVKMIEKNKINDLYFVLGGGHWNKFIKLLDKEVKNLEKYRDKIIKIGYVDDKDLAPLYSGALFFTYPSLYEGFGLPPLEAMKCGTPVITSNISSLPEVVGNSAILVNPKSEEELIKAFKDLYYSKSLRNKLIQKGLKRAKKFSWGKTVDTMVKKFKEKK